MSLDTAPARLDTPAAAPYGRRWAALAIIAVSQLMVVLDATITNIALPHAQADLGIAQSNAQWVLTAYTLTFGGLLLLGGRIADYWGRKRTFVTGVIGFAIASALGGLAQNGATLFAARGLQGVFGALLAPAALALLTVLFTDARERAKAFGVYGAIAAGGAALGLVLGGVLTEYVDWRWCLLVNIPVALIALPFTLKLLPESRAHGDTRYDVPGAILVTLGLVSLVYGFTKAAEDGWTSGVTLTFIGVAAALLAAFVLVEARSSHPLLPLRVLTDRNRGGAYLSSLLIGAGFIGSTLFLTYYFQNILGYSPVKAGLATLPMSAGVFASAGIASALLPKAGARVLMSAGGLIAASGMLLLSRIGVDTGYASHVLPGLLLLGFGLGFLFVPLGNVALVGVDPHDAGAASAVVNASQQVGGSLGVALLNTVAISAGTAYLEKNPPMDALGVAEGTVHGFQVGFAWAAALLAVGAVVVMVFIRAGREQLKGGAGAVHIG
ncbi:MFS transporter [Luedemannella flava]|uniref:MFS transporter n=1 Tax=Luedemannella flava TaxID=349316 RepID=A0ABP4YN72_9ACTN